MHQLSQIHLPYTNHYFIQLLKSASSKLLIAYLSPSGCVSCSLSSASKYDRRSWRLLTIKSFEHSKYECKLSQSHSSVSSHFFQHYFNICLFRYMYGGELQVDRSVVIDLLLSGIYLGLTFVAQSAGRFIEESCIRYVFTDINRSCYRLPFKTGFDSSGSTS